MELYYTVFYKYSDTIFTIQIVQNLTTLYSKLLNDNVNKLTNIVLLFVDFRRANNSRNFYYFKRDN